MSETQQRRTGGRGGYHQRDNTQNRDSVGRRGGFSSGGRGGGWGGHRSGHLQQHSGNTNTSTPGERKRENILNLTKHIDKAVLVKFQGGREGILKGFDPLTNLVLDDATEVLREVKEDAIYEHTRALGLVVARGPTVIMISPLDGTEEIENPFVNYMAEDDLSHS